MLRTRTAARWAAGLIGFVVGTVGVIGLAISEKVEVSLPFGDEFHESFVLASPRSVRHEWRVDVDLRQVGTLIVHPSLRWTQTTADASRGADVRVEIFVNGGSVSRSRTDALAGGTGSFGSVDPPAPPSEIKPALREGRNDIALVAEFTVPAHADPRGTVDLVAGPALVEVRSLDTMSDRVPDRVARLGSMPTSLAALLIGAMLAAGGVAAVSKLMGPRVERRW